MPEMLVHISEIVEATELPVNADFGNAFADEPERVARNVKACADTGVAGLSVEMLRAERRIPCMNSRWR